MHSVDVDSRWNVRVLTTSQRVVNLSDLHAEKHGNVLLKWTNSIKILLSVLLLLLVIVEPLTLDMLFLKILQTNISSYK